MASAPTLVRSGRDFRSRAAMTETVDERRHSHADHRGLDHQAATILVDDELIRAALHGDLDAFARLTVRYQDAAFRVAWSVTGNPHDAEDAAQEGFIRAYRALDRFRLGSPFRPWLMKIILNEARGRRRSRGRSDRLSARLGILHLEELETDPMDQILLREDSDTLAQAIRRLSSQHRGVIYLRYFLDLTEAETADVLDVPRGTVKSRLSRALDQLRAIMSDAP